MPAHKIKIPDILHNGATLKVKITPPEEYRDLFTRGGMGMPEKEYLAMIDTGCTYTTIDLKIAAELGLVSDLSVISGTAKGKQKQPVYDLQLTLLGLNFTVSPKSLSCPSFDFENDETFEIQVLIGRDILENYILQYNGIENYYAIGF